MNIKKIAYSIMTLSFVLIISGCVSSFLIGLRQDRQETYYRMNLVYDEFEVFSANTSVFEEFRDDLYNISFSNLYYDTMPMNDYTIKNKLSNYERIVDELEKNMENLKKLCNNMYYPESNANSQCVNYKSIYEQLQMGGTTMKCSLCGSENNEGKFCTSCGAKLPEIITYAPDDTEKEDTSEAVQISDEAAKTGEEVSEPTDTFDNIKEYEEEVIQAANDFDAAVDETFSEMKGDSPDEDPESNYFDAGYGGGNDEGRRPLRREAGDEDHQKEAHRHDGYHLSRGKIRRLPEP